VLAVDDALEAGPPDVAIGLGAHGIAHGALRGEDAFIDPAVGEGEGVEEAIVADDRVIEVNADVEGGHGGGDAGRG